MTNPSTMTQESPAGYQAGGAIAKADIFMTLKNGYEVVCPLNDGKTMVIIRDKRRQILQVKTFENLRNLATEFPQVVQELKAKMLNMVDFDGQDFPVPNGLPVVDPNLGLFDDSDLAGPMVSCTEHQITNSVGYLTGYFETATPVGSQRPEPVTGESFHDQEDAQDSISLTEEANKLNLPGSEELFQQATPVPSSQREMLSSFWDNEAISSPNIPERREPRYPSSFEFNSSVTETERSLERDIDISLLWGESSEYESTPKEIPDD